jgi:uncharacterized spore protein YtfJ
MEFKEAISGAADSITVKRVFGEAYERNGVTVIPTAEVMGGGGGGQERGPTEAAGAAGSASGPDPPGST